MKMLFGRGAGRHEPVTGPEYRVDKPSPLSTEEAFSKSLLALETAIDNQSHQIPQAAKAVVHDAHEHLSRILPESPLTDISPTIRDVYLLAQAYDLTGDTKILTALAYILDTAPPAFTNELREAYQQATANGTPHHEGAHYYSLRGGQTQRTTSHFRTS